jgi:hypothetical protein
MESDGRGAGRTKFELSVGVTLSGSNPATLKTARAKSNHVASPEFVPW